MMGFRRKVADLGGMGVARPERVLIAAMVRMAVLDARSRSKNVSYRDKMSARRFVRSGAFVDFCEWLGMRPSAIREVVDSVEEEGVQ